MIHSKKIKIFFSFKIWCHIFGYFAYTHEHCQCSGFVEKRQCRKFKRFISTDRTFAALSLPLSHQIYILLVGLKVLPAVAVCLIPFNFCFRKITVLQQWINIASIWKCQHFCARFKTLECVCLCAFPHSFDLPSFFMGVIYQFSVSIRLVSLVGCRPISSIGFAILFVCFWTEFYRRWRNQLSMTGLRRPISINFDSHKKMSTEFEEKIGSKMNPIVFFFQHTRFLNNESIQYLCECLCIDVNAYQIDKKSENRSDFRLWFLYCAMFWFLNEFQRGIWIFDSVLILLHTIFPIWDIRWRMSAIINL